ncbi:MAG TPA: hypothetical protein VI299_05180, partial [Polyangiales bacterium]
MSPAKDPREGLVAPVRPPTIDQDERRRRGQQANTYLGPVGGVHVVSASSGAPRTFRAQLATDFFSKKDYVYRGDHLHYVGAALSLGLTPVEHLELSAAFTLRRLRDSGSDSLIPDTLHTTGDSNYDVKA